MKCGAGHHDSPAAEPIPASRGAKTLAVRIPALELLRALIHAHRSTALDERQAQQTKPAIEQPFQLARELQSGIDGIVDTGTKKGEASAILDLTGNEPRLILE